jgi:hypothetical protein
VSQFYGWDERFCCYCCWQKRPEKYDYNLHKVFHGKNDPNLPDFEVI